ncbi:MAG: hypothetical protein H9789_02335 [Candidatus Paraprevotella stercoravium]|jgi:Ca2+/Na+ antiporter|uniref:Uncharacterized protein n=1 Tax=Candidatus Paraprevotella stercoravium TaxID=2838725 RepID=A0A9E2L6W1_9BACT|nr:hypothetical protein [Candidatus Paraprevotella stercoravium]
MDKKKIIVIASVVVAVLCGCVGYLIYSLKEKSAEHDEMVQLAEMDKREMENEYAQFAKQYNEMKTQINNDSLIAQLDKEQQRTEELLAELKRVKSTDAAEIARLKKELATVRAIMRGYILEIDSLNRLNQALTNENQQIKAQYSEAQTHISSLQSEKASLSDKVAIASQLDATGISMTAKNKRGKNARKIKDAKQLVVNFTIAKNITASTGMKSIYVRILKPTNEVLTNGHTFPYENKNLEYSMKRDIEYSGEEQNVTLYWDVNEFLSAGTYRVSIFADGNNIGNKSVTFEK